KPLSLRGHLTCGSVATSVKLRSHLHSVPTVAAGGPGSVAGLFLRKAAPAQGCRGNPRWSSTRTRAPWPAPCHLEVDRRNQPAGKHSELHLLARPAAAD